MFKYVGISNGKNIVCSYLLGEPNLEDYAFRLSSQISTVSDTRKTYAASGVTFHALIKGGNIYLCAAPPDVSRANPNGLLDEDKYNSGKMVSGTDAIRNQVDEVKGVMSQNIEKVLERGDRLDDLMATTDRLQDTSLQFHQTSRKVRRKMWWHNMKTNLVIGGIVLTVIVVVVLVILISTGAFDGGGGGDDPTKAPTKGPTPPVTTVHRGM